MTAGTMNPLETAGVDRAESGPGPRLLNMAADGFATNQTVNVQWFAGEEVTPCLWVGQSYDQFTRPVPAERPGKK